MTESMLESSKEGSGMKTADFFKTPEKDDCKQLTYSDTPVSNSESRRRSLVILSENKQKSPASENEKNASSDTAESRFNICQMNALEKVRVSLFQNVEKKTETKNKIFSVNATSFYGPPTKERYMPLAPGTLGTRNQKLDKNKPNISPYDFPDKKVARKRKSGEINSGVGHGIKKSKSKLGSTKNEISNIDECIKIDNQREILQKENVEETENLSNSIEDYNPNKKFFKHKRPVKYEISVGIKPKQKKNMRPKETTVSYSNVFGSSKSKKHFYEHLNTRRPKHSNSKDESNLQHSLDISKKQIFNQYSEYEQNDQKLMPEATDGIDDRLKNSEECSNLETETEYEVNEGTDEELPLNIAMDIENNNFSDNEMMTDVTIHNSEELESQTTVGNTLFFMESLASHICFQQNNSKENSSDNDPLKCCSKSKQHQMDIGQNGIENNQYQKCNIVYKPRNEKKEFAQYDYHKGFCDLEFQGWEKNHRVDIGIGTRSNICIVKPFDPKCNKKKAFDILQVINQELGLCDDELIDNNKKYFFMYVKEKLVIGVLVAEYLESAFRLESNSSAPYRLFESIPVKCGVKSIWVSKKHRRQGIATTLMDSLRIHFFDKYQMKIDDLAISIPTQSGRLFAEKYMGTCDLKFF